MNKYEQIEQDYKTALKNYYVTRDKFGATAPQTIDAEKHKNKMQSEFQKYNKKLDLKQNIKTTITEFPETSKQGLVTLGKVVAIPISTISFGIISKIWLLLLILIIGMLFFKWIKK